MCAPTPTHPFQRHQSSLTKVVPRDLITAETGTEPIVETETGVGEVIGVAEPIGTEETAVIETEGIESAGTVVTGGIGSATGVTAIENALARLEAIDRLGHPGATLTARQSR